MSFEYSPDFASSEGSWDAFEDANSAPILLGRYRVIALKNEGGFGAVYMCWDTRLQRRVAIKVMPLAQTAYGAQQMQGGGMGQTQPQGGAAYEGLEGSSDMLASTMAEALGEARASSNLTHPNIVTVHDFETDGTAAYLVMEYVDGLSLQEVLARVEGGVLLGDEAAYVVQSLANAVEYAHENGVLHLDIKPSNVLIANDGRVLLGDFGMASLQSASGFADARGGTVGYMPPEQIEGDVVDERADIFALGAVAYEAITGTAPFAADTAEKSKKLIEKGAQPLGAVDVPLVGMVEDTIARSLAADPGERPIQAIEAFEPAVHYLGDPEAGRASLKSLLSQTLDEEEEFDESVWRSLDPVGRRIPWLANVLVRGANGLVSGFFAWELLPLLGINDTLMQTLVALAVLLCGCLWAPVGAGLCFLALALALFSCGVSAFTILAALCLLAISAGWTLVCGSRGSLSASSVLSAPLVKISSIAPALAAYTFGPLQAALTAASSVLMCRLYGALLTSNPGSLLHALLPEASAATLQEQVLAFLGSPGFWACLGVFSCTTCIASLVARIGIPGKGRLVFSQLLCFAGVLCGLSLEAGLGAGTIWGIPPLIPSVFGLVFCVIMSGVCILFGLPRTLPYNQEGEDELS